MKMNSNGKTNALPITKQFTTNKNKIGTNNNHWTTGFYFCVKFKTLKNKLKKQSVYMAYFQIYNFFKQHHSYIEKGIPLF